MSMVCCPSCGAEMSLDVLLSHAELRQAAVALAQKSIPLASLVLRYIGLFRPAKNRMGSDRWAKLITQLLPDLQREAITHRGRDWRMPLDAWRAGLETMLEKAAREQLKLPLDNHAYLYAVLVGLADKVEGQAEREAEAERRGVRPYTAVKTTEPGPTNVDRGFTSVDDIRRAVRERGGSLT